MNTFSMYMWSSLLLFFLLTNAVSVVTADDHHHHHNDLDLDEESQHPDYTSVKHVDDTIRALGEQLRIQQLGHELLVRSRGNSGIVRTRDMLTGTKPYFGSSYVGKSFAAIHNHANEKRSIGMGEVVVVLNGVEFKSRHNDFMLTSPSRNNSKYMDQQLLEFPEVPPAVLNKNSVSEQTKEMRKWFQAFHEQDYSVRDYRDYFKPVLCYLEGGWTTGNDTLREPFPSRRHKIMANTYSDLMNKHDFETSTGAHMPSENYAYLPRKIVDYEMSYTKGLTPLFAQWSYRITCHKLKKDLPTANIVPVLDLAKRMADRQNLEEYVSSRTARFSIQSEEQESDEHHKPKPMPRAAEYDLLDSLMSEIPGKDNYPGKLEDISFGGTAYGFETNKKGHSPKLNSAYYHRLYSNKRYGTDDMLPFRRSFSDETIFMAMNSRPEMSASEVEYCSHNTCKTLNQKWSYAIPLEIVFLNPLTKWNPHKILDRGSDLVNEGKKVFANGRNGGMTSETAYDGVNDGLFFTTPEKFYGESQPREMYPADTGMSTYGVLDHERNVQKTVGAGYRIVLPRIPGIKGRVRIRYPIAPVHEEGSAIWKEFAALREMVLHPFQNGFMFDSNSQKKDTRRHK